MTRTEIKKKTVGKRIFVKIDSSPLWVKISRKEFLRMHRLAKMIEDDFEIYIEDEDDIHCMYNLSPTSTWDKKVSL